MIESRFKTAPAWTIFIGTVVFFVTILVSIYCMYSNSALLTDGAISTKVFLGLSLIGFVIFLFYASVYLKRFCIDYNSKNIEVKNIVTRQKVKYSFSDLDGYYDTAVKQGGKITHYYKAISIIRNKAVIALIDSYYISNLPEIREYLSDLKYLGKDSNYDKTW